MNRDTRRTRIVLALLLVVSLAVVTLDYRGGDQSPVDSLRDLVAGALGPVESAAGAVARPVADTVSALGDLGSQHERITTLDAMICDAHTQARQASNPVGTHMDRLARTFPGSVTGRP